MKNDTINISRIVKNVSHSSNDSGYAVCWIKDEIKGVDIDGVLYPNISISWIIKYNGSFTPNMMV